MQNQDQQLVTQSFKQHGSVSRERLTRHHQQVTGGSRSIKAGRHAVRSVFGVPTFTSQFPSTALYRRRMRGRLTAVHLQGGVTRVLRSEPPPFAFAISEQWRFTRQGRAWSPFQAVWLFTQRMFESAKSGPAVSHPVIQRAITRPDTTNKSREGAEASRQGGTQFVQYSGSPPSRLNFQARRFTGGGCVVG